PSLPYLRGFDLDPEAFWGALARSARAVMARLPDGARILGVVATSQREGCVFVDRAGEVLYAGPNLDARAAVEGIELLERIPAAGPRRPRRRPVSRRARPCAWAAPTPRARSSARACTSRARRARSWVRPHRCRW